VGVTAYRRCSVKRHGEHAFRAIAYWRIPRALSGSRRTILSRRFAAQTPIRPYAHTPLRSSMLLSSEFSQPLRKQRAQ